MAPFSKKSIFLVGVVLLVHAIYMAFSMRQQLQAWHHGATGSVALAQQGTKVATPAMLVPLAIEVLVGLCLTLLGFILRSPLAEARLVDFTKTSRYDQQMHTGVPFMTFNHRGAARNRASDAANSSSANSSEARKKD